MSGRGGLFPPGFHINSIIKMKKTILALALALLALGTITLTGCKSARDKKVDVVAEKMEERNPEISQEEYAAAFDYIEAAYRDMEALRNDENHDLEYKLRKSQEWDEKYPQFRAMVDLVNTNPEKLDSANKVRLERVQVLDNQQKVYRPLGEEEIKHRPRK